MILNIASIAIALMTATALGLQILRERKGRKADMLLALRREFAEPDRVRVHKALRNREWDTGIPEEMWSLIDDYLGLFEICWELVKDGVVSLESFANYYEYRVHNILNSAEIVEAKLEQEAQSWKYFLHLVDHLLRAGYLEEHHGNARLMTVLERVR